VAAPSGTSVNVPFTITVIESRGGRSCHAMVTAANGVTL
jgi:hypothetical protein